jgi:hypothetical protein
VSNFARVSKRRKVDMHRWLNRFATLGPLPYLDDTLHALFDALPDSDFESHSDPLIALTSARKSADNCSMDRTVVRVEVFVLVKEDHAHRAEYAIGHLWGITFMAEQ